MVLAPCCELCVPGSIPGSDHVLFTLSNFFFLRQKPIYNVFYFIFHCIDLFLFIFIFKKNIFQRIFVQKHEYLIFVREYTLSDFKCEFQADFLRDLLHILYYKLYLAYSICYRHSRVAMRVDIAKFVREICKFSYAKRNFSLCTRQAIFTMNFSATFRVTFYISSTTNCTWL